MNHLYPYLAFVCSNELTLTDGLLGQPHSSLSRFDGQNCAGRALFLASSKSTRASQNKARSSSFNRHPSITFFPLYIYSARTDGPVRKLFDASANLVGPTAVPPPSRRCNLAHQLLGRLGRGPLRLAVNKSAGLLYSRP